MATQQPSFHGSAPVPRTRVLGAAAVITLGVLAAYHGIFPAPFVCDDRVSILGNPTLHSLARAFFPPRGGGQTVEGRPLLNLSFALNYALSGLAPGSYHAFNLAVHLAAALALFGIVRRTWGRVGVEARGRRNDPGPAGWSGSDGVAVGFAVALLWALHPLQTESVSYVAQRAESLMGLFYLLTLYGFVRAGALDGEGPAFARGTRASAGEKAARRRSYSWFALSWLGCLFGMATKEVMVTAPLLVLLYDRTFISGSFQAAWRSRKGYYLALASTWLLLLFLVVGAGDRGGTIGAASGVTPWQYLLCQSRAIVHYLRLSFWPAPLVFDYGPDLVGGLGRVLPDVVLDLALLGGTLFALRRKPALGFLGAWFFVILAPSSSVIGGSRQMLAEHRMYLPLAAVITFVVAGLYARGGRRTLVLVLPLGVILGVATAARNRHYRSALALYRETVAERPGNPWAHSDYGLALDEANETEEAMRQFDEALRLKPDLAEAQYNRGVLLAREGRVAEAIAAYEGALRSRSSLAPAHHNLSLLLLQAGRTAEAVEQARQYAALNPEDAAAHLDLGNDLLLAGAKDAAAKEFERAGTLGFDSAADCYRLGLGFSAVGRWAEAEGPLEKAVRKKPDQPAAQIDLGNALTMTGRVAEAIPHYRRAIALQPGSADAHYDLASALALAGQPAGAADEYEAALRLLPDFPEAVQGLDAVRRKLPAPAAARKAPPP